MRLRVTFTWKSASVRTRIFERDGDDLYCEVPVPFTLAAMGGELEIPTLDGQVKLKVPAETQTGRMFRLKGEGRQIGPQSPHG